MSNWYDNVNAGGYDPSAGTVGLGYDQLIEAGAPATDAVPVFHSSLHHFAQNFAGVAAVMANEAFMTSDGQWFVHDGSNVFSLVSESGAPAAAATAPKAAAAAQKAAVPAQKAPTAADLAALQSAVNALSSKVAKIPTAAVPEYSVELIQHQKNNVTVGSFEISNKSLLSRTVVADAFLDAYRGHRGTLNGKGKTTAITNDPFILHLTSDAYGTNDALTLDFLFTQETQEVMTGRRIEMEFHSLRFANGVSGATVDEVDAKLWFEAQDASKASRIGIVASRILGSKRVISTFRFGATDAATERTWVVITGAQGMSVTTIAGGYTSPTAMTAIKQADLTALAMGA